MDYKKQKGVVLLVAVVLLLVITIIGVTAVSSSSVKTQIAGNSMFSMLVYQGAESTLSKSVNFKNTIDSIVLAPEGYPVPGNFLSSEAITAGATLTSSANVTYEGIYDCPVSSNRISSSNVKCRLFKVDATSRIQATNAKGHHTMGVAFDWVKSFN